MERLGVNLNPPARQLRQFAAIFLVFFGLAGAWVLKRWSVLPPAIGLWVLAVGVGVPGLLWPGWVRWIYRVMVVVSWPVGWVLSYVLLGVVYFGVVTSLGLVMRVFGRDPLGRRFDKAAESYWIPKEPAVSVDRYFRQF